jgi:hypothetical protein
MNRRNIALLHLERMAHTDSFIGAADGDYDDRI